MVFNATFNNISVISWQSVILVEETGVPGDTWRKPSTCRKSLTNFITYCCIEYTSKWVGFELKTLVVIGTDCTGSCKSNYHTITTTTAPKNLHNSESKILTISDWRKLFNELNDINLLNRPIWQMSIYYPKGLTSVGVRNLQLCKWVKFMALVKTKYKKKIKRKSV